MSSPRAATAKSVRCAKPAVRSSEKPSVRAAPGSSASVRANAVAAEIEQGLLQGRLDVISPEAAQALTAAVCKLYSAKVEAGQDVLPLTERGGVSATDVMTVASGLLRSVNLAVFELGMWQSWTGR